MDDDQQAVAPVVPVWTLTTGDVRVPTVSLDDSMSGTRLAELRGVLATLADRPVATLEQHPLPSGIDRGRGIPLDAASPLADHLSRLVAQVPRGTATVPADGEALYRMVVPAKVAAQFGQGTVRSMRSASGGVHSALVGNKGIAAQASFVPVGGAAAAGTVGGAGTTAGVAVAGGTALTVAAPLVLMAVAVGVSAYADHQRQQAIGHITGLLEQLHDARLDDERSALDGCRDAIDKATAVLLDEGRLGASLGLDSAVHAISTALVAAERRLAKWQDDLDALPTGKGVDVPTLSRTFPGIAEQGGTFRAHLELASLAVALKRRVVVLQAVEHLQLDQDNAFENFARTLKSDQQRLDHLERGIAGVLVRIASLDLVRPQSRRPPVFTAVEVDRLLGAARRVRALGDGVDVDDRATDVAIEIVREKDGSVVVLPAQSA
jgi:hypothetical protein